MPFKYLYFKKCTVYCSIFGWGGDFLSGEWLNIGIQMSVFPVISWVSNSHLTSPIWTACNFFFLVAWGLLQHMRQGTCGWGPSLQSRGCRSLLPSGGRQLPRDRRDLQHWSPPCQRVPLACPSPAAKTLLSLKACLVGVGISLILVC